MWAWWKPLRNQTGTTEGVGSSVAWNLEFRKMFSTITWKVWKLTTVP